MDLLNFISEIGKLKDLERTGWVLNSVKKPESVSDHSFRLAIMAMLYSKKLGLDTEKCIKMALIHDMQEIYTRDIATKPKEKDQIVSNKEKAKLENQASVKLFSKLPNKFKQEMISLWSEFSEQKSKESLLIFDLDKIETLLQVLEYKKAKRTKEDLGEFFKTYEPLIKTKTGKELCKKIKQEYLKEIKKR